MKTDRFVGDDGLVHLVAAATYFESDEFVVTACIKNAARGMFLRQWPEVLIIRGTRDLPTCMTCLANEETEGPMTPIELPA